MNAKDRQTIGDAARQPSVLRAALAYAECGLSVVPVRGKVCTLDWERHQSKPATEKEIMYWYGQGLLQGVGIITGAVSNNLVVLDLDGLDCVAEFERAFPHLTDTYIVVSGSGNGAHFYFHADNLPPTTRCKGFELRANGHYVVAPPSMHTSGKRYTVANDSPIQRRVTLAAVQEWINAKKPVIPFPNRAEPVGKFRDMPTSRTDDPFTFNPRNPGRQMPRAEYLRLSWLANAVQSELGSLRAQTQGARNDTLFRASIVLAQLVAGGELDEQRTRRELLSAAAAIGTPDDEAQRTVTSGFQRGLKEPRRVPSAKRG